MSRPGGRDAVVSDRTGRVILRSSFGPDEIDRFPSPGRCFMFEDPTVRGDGTGIAAGRADESRSADPPISPSITG